MNRGRLPEAARQRELEEHYPPGHFTRHTVTQRQYYIASTCELGMYLVQAVRGPDSSRTGSPSFMVPWDKAEHYEHVTRFLDPTESRRAICN